MATTKVQSELIVDDVALAGNPTTTTQSAGNNTTRIATTAFVTTAVDNLIASAPGTMDTLNEIAAALGDDPSFTTTVNNAIATKLNLSGGTMTGALIINSGGANTSLTTSSTDAANWMTMTDPSGSIFFGNSGANYQLWVGAAKQLEVTSSAATFSGTLSSGAITTTGITVDSRLVIDGAAIYDNSTNGNSKGFRIGGAGLVPLNGSGTDTNNIVDIGTATYKFKDLYLSGTISSGAITSSGNLDVNGSNFTLGSDNNAEINLRAGVGGTNGAINWTFNSDSTNYASIELPYDTRASTGLYIHSGYPITLDAATGNIDFQINGSSQGVINNNRAYFLRPITQGGHTGSAAGIGVSLGDVNGAELGPGYLTLARDDVADADQILLMKNGNLHTKMQTIANAFVIHADGSDIHFRTNEGGTSRKINFSGSIPSFKPFDSDNNAIDLGTSGARWRDLYLRDDILIGNAPATGGLASAGVAIYSGAVGSNALNGCLSMTGTGGDFYAENWTTSQGNSNGPGFGRLAAFSPSTDYLVMQYRSGGTSNNIMFQHASGNVTVSGTLSDSSDIKLKKNVQDLPSQLEKIKQLRPVAYTRKSNNNEEIGFIAQEVEALYTELVNTEQQPTGEMDSDGNPENEDIKVLAYGRLTAVLTKAIQEQQVIIDDLKSRIEALEG